MIDGAEWPLEARGTILTDRQQPFCKVSAPLAANPVEAFANRFGDRRRQAFPGQFGELPGEPMGLLILDVHAHICIPHRNQSAVAADISLNSEMVNPYFGTPIAAQCIRATRSNR